MTPRENIQIQLNNRPGCSLVDSKSTKRAAPLLPPLLDLPRDAKSVRVQRNNAAAVLAAELHQGWRLMKRRLFQIQSELTISR